MFFSHNENENADADTAANIEYIILKANTRTLFWAHRAYNLHFEIQQKIFTAHELYYNMILWQWDISPDGNCGN